MAKKNPYIADVFCDIHTKYIEQSTKRNIWKLFATPKQLKKTHDIIVDILTRAGEIDNKYMEFVAFESFAKECYESAKEKKRAKEEEQKTLEKINNKKGE